MLTAIKTQLLPVLQTIRSYPAFRLTQNNSLFHLYTFYLQELYHCDMSQSQNAGLADWFDIHVW